MKFEEIGKLFQSIELRLRGRSAIVAIGAGILVVALWLMMKDYAAHPMFSAIAASCLVGGLLIFLGFGLLGKTRPEEIPDKSFMHVDSMGIYVAHGIGSHRDMVHLMRHVFGLKKLPPPSHVIKGSASNPENYVALTAEQSRAVIAKVEEGIGGFLSDFVRHATSESDRPQIVEHLPEQGDETPPIKGKL